MTRKRNELNTTSPRTTREVYQVLEDVALGTRVMKRYCKQSWSEINLSQVSSKKGSL